MKHTLAKTLPITAFLWLAACGSDDAQTYTVDLLSSEAVTGLNGSAKVTLFGFNALLADAPATVLDSVTVAVDALPTQIELTWPSDAYTLIEFGAPVSPDNARYYLVVSVDADGDNLICMGDYIRDFDQSPFQTFADNPGAVSLFVKLKDTDDCQAFVEHRPTTL